MRRQNFANTVGTLCAHYLTLRLSAFYRAVCNHVDAIAVSISCPLNCKAMLLKQFHIYITLTRTSEHWTPDSGFDEIAAEKRF